MIIVIEGDAVSIRDVSDFSRFHVESDLDPEAMRRVLALNDAGTAGEGEADIHIDFIIAESGKSGEPGWVDGFTAMREFASRRGWISADGRTVRAHIERPA